ncbi:DUF1905 domain-containing protein [Arthrobacter sp. HLT1-21]
MELKFAGTLWRWMGPASWYFITVPPSESLMLRENSSSGSRGWGMIPVTVSIGGSIWETSLFPQEQSYVVR